MPIYEYFCPNNNKIYSFFARSLAYAGAQPRCPENPKFQMERMISSFSVTGRAREEGEGAPIDDPNLEAARSQMEREFDSMHPDNPDPRQVARMLRTMTRLSGEKMPAQMEEVMRRLEAGERLDKLEEEFGDVSDTMGADPGDDAALIGSGELKALKERLRAGRSRPMRDPIMYDMSEYAVLPVSRPAKPRGSARKRAK